MTKTMLNIAYEFLKEHQTQDFKTLFKLISQELKPKWDKQKHDLTPEQWKERKIGELYKLLTLDKRFLRLKNTDWSLAENYTIEELKKLNLEIRDTSK